MREESSGRAQESSQEDGVGLVRSPCPVFPGVQHSSQHVVDIRWMFMDTGMKVCADHVVFDWTLDWMGSLWSFLEFVVFPCAPCFDPQCAPRSGNNGYYSPCLMRKRSMKTMVGRKWGENSLLLESFSLREAWSLSSPEQVGIQQLYLITQRNDWNFLRVLWHKTCLWFME